MKTAVGAKAMTMVPGRLSDYAALGKPRVTGLVAVAAAVGFHLARTGSATLDATLATVIMMVGVGLVAVGGNAFNQLIERELDGRMRRTADRPLPAGRLQPGQAFCFASVMSVAGLGLLAWFLNPACAAVAAGSLLIYVLIYTPMKRVTPLAVLVGAVPGALPPVIGWTAVTGSLGAGGWLVFAIVFVWQVPHFQAIAWLYREEYARAGFRVLAVAESTGRRVVTGMIASSLILIPVSLLPTYFGLLGFVYYVGAMILGFAFLAFALEVARLRTRASAQQHQLASLVYLVLLFALMSVDKVA